MVLVAAQRRKSMARTNLCMKGAWVVEEDDGEPAEVLLTGVEAIIHSIVRSKLHVTLIRSDLREENIEGQDLLSEIRLRLLRKLNSQQERFSACIADFKAYAAKVAFNACADYLRSRYPERTRVKRCLRRLMERSPGFEVWRSSEGELLCGLAAWHYPNSFQSPRRRTLDAMGIVGHLPSSPKSGTTLSAQQWRKLVSGILGSLGEPCSLEELTAVASDLLGVKDHLQRQDLPSEERVEQNLRLERHSQFSLHLTRERLSLLWNAIGELLPWHRTAYLLNMTDGEIDVFPYYGVASVAQIGAALALSQDQYDLLFRRLGLGFNPAQNRGDAATPGAQAFAMVWNHLPIRDNLVAELLGVTRSQVIGYRSKAVQRLKRHMRNLD